MARKEAEECGRGGYVKVRAKHARRAPGAQVREACAGSGDGVSALGILLSRIDIWMCIRDRRSTSCASVRATRALRTAGRWGERASDTPGAKAVSIVPGEEKALAVHEMRTVANSGGVGRRTRAGTRKVSGKNANRRSR